MLAVALLVAPAAANAAEPGLSFAEALTRARTAAPDLRIAAGNEDVAKLGVGVAGLYPNPTVSIGTSTKAATFSAGLTIPLVILGQIGAGKDAARAELRSVQVESEIVWAEVRAATGHAYVELWRAEQIAGARRNASALAGQLDDLVRARAAAGAAPDLEALRAHAERLSIDAEASEATTRIAAARSALGRWIGVPTGAGVNTAGEPPVPNAPPALTSLLAQVTENPAVRREEADAMAAEARADRERVFRRPLMTLDVGVDHGDPTFDGGTNYRAMLGIEVPLFNFRGPLIEREVAGAAVARLRVGAQRARLESDLTVAVVSFTATDERVRTLEGAVLPAAEAAAKATKESYDLGRAPLVAVIDAERARVDAHVTLVEARAARANAWIDVEKIVGVP